MTTVPEIHTTLREVTDLLRSAPQGALDPAVARDRIGEALRVLTGLGREEIWIDAAEAKRLLGIEIDATVPTLVELGLLRGQSLLDGRLQVPLVDVLRERAIREALSAFPGEEMSAEELRILRETRPGRNPWDRAVEPAP